MTLQQLKYLVTVAECGSITAAAEKLYISQPSLSTSIHSLEKEMGVQLLFVPRKGLRSHMKENNCFLMPACYWNKRII